MLAVEANSAFLFSFHPTTLVSRTCTTYRRLLTGTIRNRPLMGSDILFPYNAYEHYSFSVSVLQSLEVQS